jgi:hypothetical protein
MPDIAEVKLSGCGLQKKLQLRNCGVAVAEQHSLKSCGSAIAEVLSSSCEIAIADSKKSCARPPLLFRRFVVIRSVLSTFCRYTFYLSTFFH